MNLTRRELLTLGASMLACTSIPAARAQPRTGASSAGGQRIVRVAVQQVVNNGALAPLREQSNVGSRILPSVFESLIEMDIHGDLAPVPALAESWQRIDARTLELSLRQGVLFHNGDEMTAEDVAFTFGPRYMLGDTQPKRADETATTISTVGNRASAVGDGVDGPMAPPEVVAVGRRLWPSLESVEVVDRYTVRFVNAVPDVTLEGRLSRLGSQVICKRAYLEAPDWMSWARNPVAAGPFKVKEFKHDNRLVLVPHEGYYGGRPDVDELHFLVVPEVSARINGLLSGQYDFAVDVPPDQIRTVEANADFEVVGGPVLNHRIVVFDKNHPRLADARIRRAMTHAIDRDAIVEALWAGRTKVPAGLQWEFYGDMFQSGWTVPAYDPALAKRLLQEAGYQGEPIPFRVLNNYYTNQVQTSQILVEMWRAVGLNVDIQMKENWSQIFDPTDPRAIRDWSNSASYNDPVSSLVNQHGPNGQQQQKGEWSNDEFNRLSTILENSTDHEERETTFRRMLEIAEREDPAYTVLHQNVSFYGKRRNVDWNWSPTFYMDFRAGNLALPSVRT